jgi:hypothetical protein
MLDMADGNFAHEGVTCPHCKAKQVVRVRPFPPGSGYVGPDPQKITCIAIACGKDFDVTVEGKIVGGPFPAAESAGS